jgi:carboxyl-terminal processing protease
MNDGRIVTTRGRHPESRQSYEARPGDVTGGVPMVVLVNGRSASSSEIVAAALQDNGRAVLIGSNSFGKGTVQTVFTLPNEGELVLTWSRFHAPSGYALEGLGVLPNVCTARRGANLQTAIRGLQTPDPALVASFRRWKTIETPDARLAGPLRALCPAPQGATPTGPGADIDLEIAKAVLREPALYNRALALSQGLPGQGRNGATDIADPDE